MRRAELMGQAWALEPSVLDALARDVIAGTAAVALMPGRALAPYAGGSGIAVIPIVGALSQRGGFEFFGGSASADRIRAEVTKMAQDPSVSAIVLDMDSPGGQVDGISELADAVWQARHVKPVVCVINHRGHSAAYHVASNATEIVVAPGGTVGAIGVYTVHQDVSRAAENAGVTVTVVSAGRRKLDGSPFAPLSPDARAALQDHVDAAYEVFVKAVARGRGVTVNTARGERFGEGRSFRGDQAIARGMADRIGTLDATLSRLVSGRGRVAGVSASSGEGYDGEAEVRLRRARMTGF